MGYKTILKDPYIMKNNNILILNYINNNIFAYKKSKVNEVYIYIIELKI